MPWMATNFPSIQLAVLARAAEAIGHECDRYEYFLDFAARIGLRTYGRIAGGDGTVGEAIFAGALKCPVAVDDMVNLVGLVPADVTRPYLEALTIVAEEFVESVADEVDWSQYGVIGFSLTIEQHASSMALARAIKRRHSDVTIVIGGTSCAGTMGIALLRACTAFDYAVCTDGEHLFPALLTALETGAEVNLRGVAMRRGQACVMGDGGDNLAHFVKPSMQGITFDPYFKRLERLGLRDRINAWLPIETSRGCWYGEKNQCKFCGLHELMQYRQADVAELVSALATLSDRHGIDRFFAVDLIMPQSFYRGTLQTLAQSDREWDFFYEVKANITREQVSLLKAAGVNWIQPGIESLSHRSLKLMSKGAEPFHNIQLLKWCEELSIRVSWNIIYGLPFEEDADVLETVRRIPMLYHLQPPSGAGKFQLHRFSPYFNDPGSYGIFDIRPTQLFEAVFGTVDDLAKDIAYQFDYSISAQGISLPVETELKNAIAVWRDYYKSGTSLTVDHSETRAVVHDRRIPGVEKVYKLGVLESAILSRCNGAVVARDLINSLHTEFSEQEIDSALGELVGHMLIFQDRGRILALATCAEDRNAQLIGAELAAHASLVWA